MPQLQLPIFPAGLTPITNDIAFYRKHGKVVYFHGHLPVYSHAQDDLQSLRLFSTTKGPCGRPISGARSECRW